MSYRNFPCECSFLYFSEQSSRNLNLVSPRIRLHELLKTSALTMAGREKSAGQRERERGAGWRKARPSTHRWEHPSIRMRGLGIRRCLSEWPIHTDHLRAGVVPLGFPYERILPGHLSLLSPSVFAHRGRSRLRSTARTFSTREQVSKGAFSRLLPALHAPDKSGFVTRKFRRRFCMKADFRGLTSRLNEKNIAAFRDF